MRGVLAHLVERNTGSVEVSGSSPLCSTNSLKESRKVIFHSLFFVLQLLSFSNYTIDNK